MFLVPPGGPLVFKVGYHSRKKKKNNVIRVVFQDHAGNVHAYII